MYAPERVFATDEPENRFAIDPYVGVDVPRIADTDIPFYDAQAESAELNAAEVSFSTLPATESRPEQGSFDTDSAESEHYRISLLVLAHQKSLETGDQLTIHCSRTELIEAVFPHIIRYIGFTMPDSPHADDAVQEAILAISLKLPDYQALPNARFLSWATAIARNKLIDMARKEANRARQLIAVDEAPVSLEQLPAPSSDPEDILAPERRATALTKLLSGVELDPEARAILRYRVGQQLSSEDTGKLIGGIKAGTIRVSAHRTLAHLRHSALDQNIFDPDDLAFLGVSNPE